MRLTPNTAACLVAGLALLMAGFRLGGSTPTSEELTFNIQAQAVLEGKPALFFRINDEKWLQPLAVYLNAAVRAAGAGATSGRMVSAVAGAINVALVLLIVNLITQRLWVAIAAALVLVATPAHWGLSILGTDALLPATLIMAWLYGVLRFFKFDSLRALAFAAAMLGLAVYSHPSGPLTAVFLWMLTLAVAFRRNRARLAAATILFMTMWIPAAAWFYLHPATYADTFGRWFVLAAHLRNPFDALLAFFNLNTLGTRASLYWGFLNPASLFFTGPGRMAPLLWIWLPLIVFGVIRWPRQVPRDAAALVIGTLFITPLAGATFGVPHYLHDAAAVLPLFAILAGIGLDQLVSLVRPRRPLEDDVAMAPVEGWHDDDSLPRA